VNSKFRKWVALTGVASIIVLVAGWFLLISPKRSDVSELKSQAAQQETTNSGLQVKLTSLRSQQKGLAANNAKLAQLAKKIPTTADLPGLLRQLSAAATTSNVDLTDLTPSNAVALTAAPGISAVTISLKIDGKYFDVAQYINALESLDRGLMVTGVTEATKDNAMATAQSPLLEASITAVVFTGQLTANSGSTPSPAPSAG
jgi:type IV pilus assembly protein PilO